MKKTPRTWVVTVEWIPFAGVLVRSARPKTRGPYMNVEVKAEELPLGLRQYLALPDDLTEQPLMQDIPDLAALDAIALDAHLTQRTGNWNTRELTINLPTWALPEQERHAKQNIAKGVRAIRNLRQLCDWLSADEPRQLNRHIYKGTDCGASISVLLANGEWLHNGDSQWEQLPITAKILGFTIQTIVEGSDAEVNSEPFYLPVTIAEVEAWCKEMESEADRLWHDANDDTTIRECRDCGAEDVVGAECHQCGADAVCETCDKVYGGAGDGWDGKCPECADKAAAKDDKDE